MSKYRAYEETLDSGIARIALEGPGCSCAIIPQAGFNLVSWIVDGRQIMMPTQDTGAPTTGHGNPILFPFPNRTRGAMFTFDNREIHLQKKRLPRYIHGLVFDEPFQYKFWTDESGAYCRGCVEFTPGTPLCEAYPFPCRLSVRYSFCEKGLLLDATVENLSDATMPFGFAIHPYFSKMGDDTQVFLQVPAGEYYEATPDLLPTGKFLPVDADKDMHSPRPLSQLSLDHVFHGMDKSKSCVINWANWGHSLEINADDDFINAVVYTPKVRPGFCIESQTCSTDSANLYAKGLHKESGLITLSPGENWQSQIRLSIL